MFDRGLTFGGSGNISVRLDDGWLMTPTGSSMGDLDPARLAARNLTPAGILPVLQQANRQFRSGLITASDEVFIVESGGFLHSPEEVGATVLGAYDGRPVDLRDVATIHDGAGDPEAYVLHSAAGGGDFEPAVTLTVAKRPGANAITVADKVLVVDYVAQR